MARIETKQAHTYTNIENIIIVETYYLEKDTDTRKYGPTKKKSPTKGIPKRKNDQDIVELEKEKIVFVTTILDIDVSPTFGYVLREIYIYLKNTLQEGD